MSGKTQNPFFRVIESVCERPYDRCSKRLNGSRCILHPQPRAVTIPHNLLPFVAGVLRHEGFFCLLLALDQSFSKRVGRKPWRTRRGKPVVLPRSNLFILLALTRRGANLRHTLFRVIACCKSLVEWFAIGNSNLNTRPHVGGKSRPRPPHWRAVEKRSHADTTNPGPIDQEPFPCPAISIIWMSSNWAM